MVSNLFFRSFIIFLFIVFCLPAKAAPTIYFKNLEKTAPFKKQLEVLISELAGKVNLYQEIWKQDPNAVIVETSALSFRLWVKSRLERAKNETDLKQKIASLRQRQGIDIREFNTYADGVKAYSEFPLHKKISARQFGMSGIQVQDPTVKTELPKQKLRNPDRASEKILKAGTPYFRKRMDSKAFQKTFRELAGELAIKVNLFQAIWWQDPNAIIVGLAGTNFNDWVLQKLSKAKNKAGLDRAVKSLRALNTIDIREFMQPTDIVRYQGDRRVILSPSEFGISKIESVFLSPTYLSEKMPEALTNPSLMPKDIYARATPNFKRLSSKPWVQNVIFSNIQLVAQRVDMFREIWKHNPDAIIVGEASRYLYRWILTQYSKVRSKRELENLWTKLQSRSPLDVREFLPSGTQVKILTDKPKRVNLAQFGAYGLQAAKPLGYQYKGSGFALQKETYPKPGHTACALAIDIVLRTLKQSKPKP